jgi:hypothetical protein
MALLTCQNKNLKHDPEKWAAVFPRDKRGTRLRGDMLKQTDAIMI